MGDGLSKAGGNLYQEVACYNLEAECTGSSTISEDGSSTPVVSRLPSTRQSSAERRTLIIFDWDDTLLCTSAINAQEWTPRQLHQLERIVECVLRTAMVLGETLIVTNGVESWVQNSATRYLPGLLPLLSKMMVMSARAKYEAAFPGDPFMWKKRAFKDLVAKRRDDPDWEHDGCEPVGLNLVVLGDSPAEIEAAQAVTKPFRDTCLVKTVKFKEAPSVSELLGQLRRVAQELGQIVRDENSANHGLLQRDLPDGPSLTLVTEHLDHLATWASGWRCFEKADGRCNSSTLPALWPLFT